MNKLSGILLVNKPSGPTSHDIVAQARRVFSTREVGHTGTLDPIASGLLILTFGKANKLSQYLMDGEKSYLIKIKLGVETDTLDREGKILSERPVDVSDEKVSSTIAELVGDLELSVPAYSAVKVQGKKLYELARKQEEVPHILRVMIFYSAQLQKRENSELDVILKCAKGAYVRSWVQELGKRLGCGAMVQELTRVYNAPYELSQAEDMQKIDGLSSRAWIPFNEILPHWPRVEAFESEISFIEHGQIPPGLMIRAQKALLDAHSNPSGVFIVGPEILCFLEVQKPTQTLKLKRVFLNPNLDS
jgi:tRNA pseudouridine55 synthase